MRNPFEKPLESGTPPIPKEEVSRGGRIAGSVRSANDAFFGNGQQSPSDWNRLTENGKQDMRGVQFGLLENARTQELERQIDQYHEVVSIYTDLESLYDQWHGKTNQDSKTKDHGTVFSREELRSLQMLAQRFVHLRPLINMTEDMAEEEFRNILRNDSKQKIQDTITRYLEYANIADAKLGREKDRLRELQQPVLDTSEGETTKIVEVNF